jgi:hypothetical protein
MRTRINAEERAAGYSIERTVSRVAYARNGNAHNPTREYTWHVFHNGRPIGTVARAGAAIEVIAEHRKDPR